MSIVLRVSVIAALAAVLACVPACGKKDGAGKAKIGVVTNCTDEFWDICDAGARKAAAEFNVDLLFRQPEQAFDAKAQMEIVESWAKQGLDGIVVSVINPKGQTEDLTRIAQKTPLVTMDNDADKTGRKCYVGVDNYEAGKAVGRIVKKTLPQGGTVAMFIGDTKSANAQARTQGVLDELAGEKDAKGADGTHPQKPDLDVRTYGKYHLVDRAPKEDGGPDNAQKTAGAVLARVKGLSDLCMVGLYAYNPPAILNEAKARSMTKEIKIVGFDEKWDTLRGIEAGEIEATVVQDPFAYGYESVKALATKNFDVKPIPYRVVTKDGKPDPALGGEAVEAAKFQADLRAKIGAAQKK
ncbi:D-allose transporter subunit [Gemmata obscuriglobus]|uniref:substrate-binding domain-containing protein n=1 Tax=Gemmata obscuriglobus TaxID=114 RepID=UPI0011CCFEE8|nr:substrate-binding domain-containing protein [Gemmata obscuriglobus]QEG31716.1 D-allose transporter subunit [Gemmata obscuriglobus]VTS11062.1 ABC transporter sugar-binding protein OS=Planctomyces maris DSM 8797 GN=PM8797T_24606 PE=4 SV=1: Peripla_BP_4 [Gemmata obscuriglobus UQM 2246]